MEWISFLENPSNSLRALMSQCQTTHIVSYYHPLFITLSCTLNPIDFICHLSFIFSLIVGPHRLSAIITLVSLQSQLISLLYYYFLSQYQPLQIVSYYHSTLYHFVNPNRWSAIITLVSYLFLTLLAHTDCQLSSSWYLTLCHTVSSHHFCINTPFHTVILHSSVLLLTVSSS